MSLCLSLIIFITIIINILFFLLIIDITIFVRYCFLNVPIFYSYQVNVAIVVSFLFCIFFIYLVAFVN